MCCGRNANQMTSVPNKVYVPAQPVSPTPERPRLAEFEYTGNTALTVVSPITGLKYRFPQPGARMSVDTRDRSWIAFVPHLKRCI
jgi:hypothetical protein